MNEDLLSILINTILGDITHPDYKRTVDLSNDYYAYITGIGLDKMLKQFAKREDQDAFEQRVTITQHIIPSVVSNLTAVERKVPRSNGMNRVLTYEEDDEKNTKARDMEGILDKFWGTYSFDRWMATRFIELNDLDPNTFVMIEWGDFNSEIEKPAPYPYEIKSPEAVNYLYDNNVLQWVVDEKTFDTLGWDKEEVEAKKYTIYGKNQTIVAVQVFDKGIKSAAHKEGEVFEVDGVMYFKKSDDVYFKLLFPEPHNLGKVPGARVGYKRDEVTDGRTFVSPYNEAVPYLKKTLKANSELDLTMALHAFPQKIVTARRCTNKDCNAGLVYKENQNKTCEVCKGAGYEVHTSAQDTIWVPLPRDKEEQLELDNLVTYITPETGLLEFQRLYIEYLTAECMQAVFNSDIFTTDEITTTATEKRIDLDNVYDTLFPLSVQYSRLWTYGVHLIAEITTMDSGLIAILTFSKDFKFKSKDDYIRDRNAAKEAGAPDIILRNIDDEIMQIDTAENPWQYQKYKVIESFDPFSGKTEDEIAMAVTSGTVPLEQIVLYDNYGWIFDAIEIDDPLFYNKPRDKQAEILKEKVDEIIKKLGIGQATQDPTAELAPGDEGGTTDLEAEAKAKLKGTVGGVQGIIGINQAVAEGTMTEASGEALLIELYGFDPALAGRLIEAPDAKAVEEITVKEKVVVE